jgi:glycosyltransferase involved in cell wall biosynthesis
MIRRIYMETIFDGKPTRELKNRPFYSIVVACYESSKTIRALIDSIVAQDMNDELELILSDDCSEDLSYLDIAHEYDDILSIKYVKTDYNFGPGNTREKGCSVAIGEWLCIADHDDEYIPGTLKQIKQILIESGEKLYAIANFYERDPETGNLIKEMVQTTNWNHAKFYNIDNLWKKFNIHFKKDLRTHEDIYISSNMNWIMMEQNESNSPTFIDLFCYYWNNRKTTISRQKYGDHSFIEVFMDDYLKSTGDVYLEKMEQGLMKPENAFWNCIDVLLYLYFFTNSFVFRKPNSYLVKNIEVSKTYLRRIKDIFNVTNDYIIEYVSEDDAKMFFNTMEGAFGSCGPHLAKYSLREWLNYLNADPDRTKMSDLIRKDNNFNDKDKIVLEDFLKSLDIKSIKEKIKNDIESGKIDNNSMILIDKDGKLINIETVNK